MASIALKRPERNRDRSKDHLAVIEQAADEGGLAIIDGAAGNKAQHGLVLVRFQIGVDVFCDQRVSFVNRVFGGHIGHLWGCETGTGEGGRGSLRSSLPAFSSP